MEENIEEYLNHDNIEESYKQEFSLDKTLRDEIFRKENNKMKNKNEGKSSLERYRLASARIFALILETLQQNIGKKNFILERASIDEVFVDLTNYCYNAIQKSNTSLSVPSVMNQTIDCVKQQAWIYSYNFHDQTLQKGCSIAYIIRKTVYKILGFTLSAGISLNKLTSKLAASYGKPDGQAVLYESDVRELMDCTNITKVRNFGGKLGQKVASLLPLGQKLQMGPVAKLLSLFRLEQSFNRETAKFVYDACRGIDHELVKETCGVLPKSISSSKIFNCAKLQNIEKWINLLAKDIMKRVERDSKRNNRFPKICNIHYSYFDNTKSRKSKTTRTSFPSFLSKLKLKSLMDNIRDILALLPGSVLFNHLCINATSFQPQIQQCDIATFLRKESCTSVPKSPDYKNCGGIFYLLPKNKQSIFTKQKNSTKKSNKESHITVGSIRLHMDKEEKVIPTIMNEVFISKESTMSIPNNNNSDYIYAHKLQSLFNREHNILTSHNLVRKKMKIPVKQTIESFFNKM